eukprot:TRINITY_DN4830_c0_g1_i1.p1 TRINITY_DN4830_c0_g1~~TRINITY_DN4830_c0_g1_i1.p1  ORF type:complete len:785 (-),score=192.45 TRINITY_DN4830_c0_g1_i1:15-2369(-)
MEFASTIQGDDRELVREQRLYREVSENQTFDEFEAQLAREKAERKLQKKQDKKDKKQKKKDKKSKDKHKKHKSSKDKKRKRDDRDKKSSRDKKSHRRRDESSSSSSSDSDSDDDRRSMSSSEEDGKHGDARSDDSDDRRLSKRQKRDEPTESGVDRHGFKKPTAAPSDKKSDSQLSELVREDWMMALPPRPKQDAAPSITEDPNPKKVEFKVHPREINPQLNPDSPLTLPTKSGSSAPSSVPSWKDRARQRQEERGGASSSRDDDRRRDEDRRRGEKDSFGRDIPRAERERPKEASSETRPNAESDRRSGWRKEDDALRAKQREEYERSQREALAAMQKPESAEAAAKRQEREEEERELATLDINKLGSQIMKAELMGNTELAASLKTKMEKAKQVQDRLQSNPEAYIGPPEESSSVVVMSDIDSRGRSRSATTEKLIASRRDPSDMAFIGSKSKMRVDSHDDKGERQRYFADDDASLQDVIARERLAGADDMDKAFADNITRNNRFKESAMDVMNYDDDDVDYNLWESREKKQTREKLEAKERSRAVAEFKRNESIEQSCFYCYSTKKVPKHLVLSLGEHCYLMMPERGQLVDGHVFIVPAEHNVALTMMEEHVWHEMEMFMASLTKMHQARGSQCVFIETVLNLKQKRHTVVECIPIPPAQAQMAPVYFRKAITESESEWAQHKKLIETQGKGIRKSIPPNFNYFFVQFGVGAGYAHVIEDSQKFPRFFGREVIAGILQLDAEQYIIKPKRRSFEEERKAVLAFLDMWKDFDWTVALDGGTY